MKRYGYLFEKIVSDDNLYSAYINAKRGKGWYREVKLVSERPFYYLAALKWMLETGNFHTSEYQMFIRHEGRKDREIYKLPFFPDRIVQWAIVQVIEPFILKNFTRDTYSAIPDRGIHAAAKKLRHDLDAFPDDMQYTLKIDCKKFYPSISHNLLYQTFAHKFKDPQLLLLLEEIINSISTCPATEDNIRYYRNKGADIHIVYHPDGKPYIDGIGIPIGNYLSQYDANFFLSNFDHWLKEIEGCRHVYRYMDDVTICAETKEELHKVLKDMDIYLSGRHWIRIKDNYQIFPTFVRGIDFVGYRFFRGFTLLRKTTAQDMKRKLTEIIKKGKAGNEISYHDYCCISSYTGWLKHCDSRNLEKKYIQPARIYADQYYQKHLKKGKKDDQSRHSRKRTDAGTDRNRRLQCLEGIRNCKSNTPHRQWGTGYVPVPAGAV